MIIKDTAGLPQSVVDEARRVRIEVVRRIEKRIKDAGYGTAESPCPVDTLRLAIDEETRAHNAFCDDFLTLKGRAPTAAEIEAEGKRRDRVAHKE